MADDRRLDEIHARAFHGTSDLASVGTRSGDRLLDVNESFARITGYERDELIGHEVEDLGLWVDPEQGRRILTELERGHTVTGVDVELRAKDGSIRHVRGSAELVEAGSDLYLFAIAEDRTEDLARREELFQTRRTVRTLTEARRRLSANLDLAVREERARISRELHDTTLQDLVAATLRLHTLEEALGAANRGELARLAEAIEAATSSTRALISELRHPVLERAGLAAALEVALEEIATRATLAHEVRDRLAEPPPVEVAIIAYEMVRDVLAFVELHAHASRVEIELGDGDGGLLITIDDDGGGGSAPPDASGAGEWRHTVLDPIGKRLSRIGGRLQMVKLPGRGTRVELWIPINAGPPSGGDAVPNEEV